MSEYFRLLRDDIQIFAKGNVGIERDDLLRYLEALDKGIDAGAIGGGGNAIAIYSGTNSQPTVTSVSSIRFQGSGTSVTSSGNDVTVDITGGTGGGDMSKSVYDTDNDTVVDSAEKVVVTAKNSTGSLITKGSVVYIKVTNTSANFPDIELASASTEATSSKTIGLAAQNIPDGNTGKIILRGELHGSAGEPLNTSAYSVGQTLWLSTTAGQITSTRPTFPNHAVFIGHVSRSQNNEGRIIVVIINGFEVNELHDVTASSPSVGDVLAYSTTGGNHWENKSIATILGYTPLAPNTSITAATKTKITYDSKGLVTGGADATTADIADSAGKRYVTDAQSTALSTIVGNSTSGYVLKTNGTGTVSWGADTDTTYTVSSDSTTGGGTVKLNPSTGTGTAVKVLGSGAVTVTSSNSDTLTISATDTNYYPTSYTWTTGFVAGPTGNLQMSGASNVAFGAIPAASNGTSGIVIGGNYGTNTKTASGFTINGNVVTFTFAADHGFYVSDQITTSGFSGTTNIVSSNPLTIDSIVRVFGIVFSATLTSGSPNITMSAGANTSSLIVGQSISGTGIPAGSTITSITSATTFAISQNATTTGTSSLTSTGVFTITTTYPTTPSGASTSGSVTAFIVQEFTGKKRFLSDVDILSGNTSQTKLTVNTIEASSGTASPLLFNNITNGNINFATALASTSVSNGRLNIATQDATNSRVNIGGNTSVVTIGGTLLVNGTITTINQSDISVVDRRLILGNVATQTFTASTVLNTQNVTITQAGVTTGSLLAGQTITGTNIPAGSTVTGITSSSVFTISANATATGSTTVTVGGPTVDTASTGGIILKSDSDRSITWNKSDSNWTSSEDWNLVNGKTYKINNVEVINVSTNTILSYTIGGTTGNSIVTLDGAQTLSNKKLSGGSANHVVVTSSTGVLVTESALAQSRGGTGYSTYAKGDIIYSNVTDNLAKLNIGTVGHVLTVDSTGVPMWKVSPSGFSNPMNAAGDIIYGASGGTATNLPGSATDGYVLTYDLTNNKPTWKVSASGFTNPMTAAGDIIYGTTGGAATNLPATTSNNFVLTYDTSLNRPKWAAPVGFADPMSAAGDIIYRSSSNITTKLGVGTSNVGSLLTLTSAGTLGWQELDADLRAIAALTGTSGLLKKDNTNTWSLDTATYLTSSSSLDATKISGTVPWANLPSAYIGSTAVSNTSNNSATITGINDIQFTLQTSPSLNYVTLRGQASANTGNTILLPSFDTTNSTKTLATTDQISNKTINVTTSGGVWISSGTTTTPTQSGSETFSLNQNADKTIYISTSANSSNGNATIVQRDSTGNFTTNTVTANLTGNVTGNVTGSVSGSAGSVTSNLTIRFNTGTTDDTDRFIFNGGTAKSINFAPGNNIQFAYGSTPVAGTITINATGGNALTLNTALAGQATNVQSTILIDKDYVIVTSGVAVTLPVPSTGKVVKIRNISGNFLNIWPSSGCSIDGQSANLAFNGTVPNRYEIEFTGSSTTTWLSNYYVSTSISGSVQDSLRSANLIGGAAQAIPFQNAANTTSFLNIGTTGQYLRVSSSNTLAWESVSPGGGLSSNTSFAAGTDSQGQGVLSNSTIHIITSTGQTNTALLSGVTLPTPAAGSQVIVVNNLFTDNTPSRVVAIYPPSGAKIDDNANDAKVLLYPGQSISFYGASSTAWTSSLVNKVDPKPNASAYAPFGSNIWVTGTLVKSSSSLAFVTTATNAASTIKRFGLFVTFPRRMSLTQFSLGILTGVGTAGAYTLGAGLYEVDADGLNGNLVTNSGLLNIPCGTAQNASVSISTFTSPVIVQPNKLYLFACFTHIKPTTGTATGPTLGASAHNDAAHGWASPLGTTYPTNMGIGLYEEATQSTISSPAYASVPATISGISTTFIKKNIQAALNVLFKTT